MGRVTASDFIRIRWAQREGYAHGTLQCLLKVGLWNSEPGMDVL